MCAADRADGPTGPGMDDEEVDEMRIEPPSTSASSPLDIIHHRL